MQKKKLVIFSGAGMSAESGLKTFRDNDGLWENYRVEEVATPEAWERDPEMVLDFYNQRRKQVFDATPNKAHKIIAELETYFDVEVITQNIDNLHEKAGSSKVLHLHGELLKSRSTAYPFKTYAMDHPVINWGDTCEQGAQLRPHVVWFGEEVPNLGIGQQICEEADILIIIGTSLNVYPAANLIFFAPDKAPKFLIDPANISVRDLANLKIIQKKAEEGMEELKAILLERHL